MTTLATRDASNDDYNDGDGDTKLAKTTTLATATLDIFDDNDTGD